MNTDNKDYYPTPEDLALKMMNKIKKRGKIRYLLEPSAGSGHLLDVYSKYSEHYKKPIMHVIEKDENLIPTLVGKGYNVVDRDFLTFNGPDKYDIIFMNPPFSNGDQHLLKAIDIMYSGQIVCILNAETLKNPCFNTRLRLQEKLTELKADVEFISDAFIDAERKTNVEIALIYINIEKNVEDDIFKGLSDAKDSELDFKEPNQYEITQKDSIKNLVASYNSTIKIGTETIINFYSNYNRVSNYLTLDVGSKEKDTSYDNLTELLKLKVNEFVKDVRIHYWRDILTINQVSSRMTATKIDEFNIHLQKNSNMDFTESNVRQFVINLIDNYEDNITESVVEIFDDMSRKFAWDESIHNKNVYLYNGWKTNEAFYVNKKVILPFYGSNVFIGWSGQWQVDYSIKERLNDIDKVMNYFDGRDNYVSIVEALNKAFDNGQNSRVESTYFILTAYKKGTLHLTFKDEDIRRRFNLTACKDKNWLPCDYGSKCYDDMTTEEQDVVEAFEGKRAYKKNVTDQKSLFVNKSFLKLCEDTKGDI